MFKPVGVTCAPAAEWKATRALRARIWSPTDQLWYPYPCLRRLRLAEGKALLPVAIPVIQDFLQSPDWRFRHTALMAIALIGEGCKKVGAYGVRGRRGVRGGMPRENGRPDRAGVRYGSLLRTILTHTPSLPAATCRSSAMNSNRVSSR